MHRYLLILALISATFTVAACEGSGSDDSQGGAPPSALVIVTTQLGVAVVGTPYSQALSVSGASGSASWSVSAGALPAGITLGVATLQGTPTAAGVFAFTLTITDGSGASSSRPFSLTVQPELQVLTDTLPRAVAGSGYSEVIDGFGGSGTGYQWSITAGALPAGITLAASGTPGAALWGVAASAGTSNFTVQLADSLGHVATRSMTLTVNPGLEISSGWVREATAGEPYVASVAGAGGTAAGYEWSVAAGAMPQGLGVLTHGTPFTLIQGQAQSAGTSIFTLQLRDSSLNTATRQLTLNVYDRGTILTAAGDGTTYLPGGPNGDGGLATSASLNSPSGIAFDAQGNLYIAERSGYRVRRVDAQTGMITTVAGTGIQGTAPLTYQAAPVVLGSQAQFVGISDIRIRGNHLYILDADGHAIHRLDLVSGAIVTVAGTGVPGFSGDGGPATAAQFNGAYAMDIAPNGDIVFADTFNYRIRRIAASSQTIQTIAGIGTSGTSGDGGAATVAQISFITGLCVDGQGHVYLGGGSSAPPDIHSRVRRIDASTGIISTVAGTGSQGFSGDGGPATAATFNRPASLAVDPQGHLYICDMRAFGASNNRIRRVDASTGVVTTLTGSASLGFSGDGGPAGMAAISGPFTPALDAYGNLYFCDTVNQRVRKVLKP